MNKLSSARWSERFWAWLIDVLLISILWYPMTIVLKVDALGNVGLFMLSALLFVYWTTLEGYRGQSLGKMFMNISVTGPLGEKIGFRDSAIESFGKAFLLPLDCLAGWALLRGRGQRAFNGLSNTIVAGPGEHDLGACVI